MMQAIRRVTVGTEAQRDQETEVGRRLAGAMFGLGKQQASLVIG